VLSESYGRGYTWLFKLPHILTYCSHLTAPLKEIAAMATTYNGICNYDLGRDSMRVKNEAYEALTKFRSKSSLLDEN
jgi:hypothetical protein